MRAAAWHKAGVPSCDGRYRQVPLPTTQCPASRGAFFLRKKIARWCPRCALVRKLSCKLLQQIRRRKVPLAKATVAVSLEMEKCYFPAAYVTYERNALGIERFERDATAVIHTLGVLRAAPKRPILKGNFPSCCRRLHGCRWLSREGRVYNALPTDTLHRNPKRWCGRCPTTGTERLLAGWG